MNLKLKVARNICEPDIFEINGIEADYNDFGEKRDSLPVSPYSYMCENMHFTPKPATQSVLNKYKIDVAEYADIASQLEEKLSFGRCGWCV